MTSVSRIASLIALLGLGVLLFGGMAHAQESKQIMVVYTTDDNGEVNPCG